jgi:two-component system LytT family response regulator
MKCLVLDDEPLAVEILRDYIGKVPGLECAGAFRKPLQALEFLRKNEVDLVFLDIRMPDLSGLQFLKSLPHPPLVIFTTAYSRYAAESYDYDAVDYLLKPIEFDRFLKAVHKARALAASPPKKTPGPDKSVLIKSGTKFYQTRWGDIRYVKGAGNYVTFVTKNREILSLMTMQNAADLLPGVIFVRIHKSYIVNIHHLDVVEESEVRIGETKIPIGDAYRADFLRAIRPLKVETG